MIRSEVDAGLVHIWLDRPATRNALATQDWIDLAEVVEATARDDRIVAVLLRSACERSFCSGSDLRFLAELADEESKRAPFRHAMRRAIDGVANMPVPVIAAIDGACFGAGVALALACDIRLVSPRSKFGVPPAKLGITYPVQDVRRLRTALGRAQAARLLFTGEPVDAIEALRIGLADVLSDDPLTEAIEMAKAIRANEPGAIGALKLALDHDVPDTEAAFDRTFDKMFGEAVFRRRISRSSN
jgi:enoyl-CoA hydratase/carnithine racemase